MTLCATQKLIITILTLFLLDVLLVCPGDLWNFSSLLPIILPILNPLGVALIVALWKKWLFQLIHAQLQKRAAKRKFCGTVLSVVLHSNLSSHLTTVPMLSVKLSDVF